MQIFSLLDIRRHGLTLLRILLLTAALVLLLPYVFAALGSLLQPVDTQPPDTLLTRGAAWSEWWGRFAGVLPRR